MQAKVTKPFSGRRDDSTLVENFAIDDVISGNLAQVAVAEKWAVEFDPDADAKAKADADAKAKADADAKSKADADAKAKADADAKAKADADAKAKADADAKAKA